MWSDKAENAEDFLVKLVKGSQVKGWFELEKWKPTAN